MKQSTLHGSHLKNRPVKFTDGTVHFVKAYDVTPAMLDAALVDQGAFTLGWRPGSLFVHRTPMQGVGKLAPRLARWTLTDATTGGAIARGATPDETVKLGALRMARKGEGEYRAAVAKYGAVYSRCYSDGTGLHVPTVALA